MKKKPSTEPIQLELQSDKKVIFDQKASQRILEISITPPSRKQTNDRAPLNLSLVLDRSGSMHGEKIHYVKQAAAHVVDLLEEKDIASVVVYDDEVETVVASGNMTADFKRKAKSLIHSISSGNSTFLSGGWLKGCEHVAENANNETINRTLLLTDGLANVGIQDTDELATHASELFRRGVTTSCFGVGLGYNEHLLEAMANSGGGNFHFLETSNAIPLVFEREFNELVEVAYRDVEVSLQIPNGVRVSVSASWPNEIKDHRLTIFLGNLYSERTQKIYVKLEFNNKVDGSEVTFPVRIHGKGAEEQLIEHSQTISYLKVPESEENSAPVNKVLLERYAEVDLADKATEALKLERSGDRTGASTKMRNSIQEHKANMPVSMLSKFDFMSTELLQGMDEGTRKRHHQQEYENKRGRDSDRDFHLQMINGHLLAEIENKFVLIDTGIPISLGKDPEFYFLNQVHPLSRDYMGVTLDYLERMVGTTIDILLGMDILNKYFLTIDLAGNRLTISSRSLVAPINGIPMTSFMNVPIASFSVKGKDCQMFIDTGARLSYVDHKIASTLTPVGKERDFYPGLGEFETSVFEIPFQIGRREIILRCGVLPPLLEKTVLLTGKSGIVGSELYQKYLVNLAFPENAIYMK